MSSIGSNQSSKRCELVSIAECEGLGLLITFFMAWSPARHQRRVIRGWSPRSLRHLQFLPTQRRDLPSREPVIEAGERQGRCIECAQDEAERALAANKASDRIVDLVGQRP